MKITKEKLSIGSATLALVAATSAVVANPAVAHADTLDNGDSQATATNNDVQVQDTSSNASNQDQTTSASTQVQDSQLAASTDRQSQASTNVQTDQAQNSTATQNQAQDQSQDQTQDVKGYMPDSEQQAVTTAKNTQGMTVNQAETTTIKTADPNFAKDYAEKDSANTTATINQKTAALNQKNANSGANDPQYQKEYQEYQQKLVAAQKQNAEIQKQNEEATNNLTQEQQAAMKSNQSAMDKYQKAYDTYVKDFNNGLHTWSTAAGAKSSSAEGLMKQIDKKMSLGYLAGTGTAKIPGSTPKLSAAKKAQLNKIGAYTPDLTKDGRQLRLVKDGYTWNVNGVGKVNGKDVDAAVTITGLNDTAYAGISTNTIGLDLPTYGIHGKALQNVDMKVKLTSQGKPVTNTDWLVGIYDLDDKQHANVKNASGLVVGSNVSKSGSKAQSTKSGDRRNNFRDSAIWLVKNSDTINYTFGRAASHKGKNSDWYHRLGFPAKAGFKIPKQPVKPELKTVDGVKLQELVALPEAPKPSNAPTQTDNVTPMNYDYQVAPTDSEVSRGTDQTVTYQGAGDKTPQPVHNEDQKVFIRSKITTPDGKTTYTDWQGSKTYNAIKTPIEQGYYADKAEAGAGTPTVDNPHVKDNVSYKPLGHIIPVDENGNPIQGAPTPIYNNDSSDPTKATTTNTPNLDGYTKDQDSVTPTDPGKDTPVVYRKKAEQPTVITNTTTIETPAKDIKAVHVRFQDQDGNNLAPGETLTGEKGSQYTTQPKDIPGYKLIQVPANQNGIYQDVNDDVVYVYEKINQDAPVKPQDVPAPEAKAKPTNNTPKAENAPVHASEVPSAPVSNSDSTTTQTATTGSAPVKSTITTGSVPVKSTTTTSSAPVQQVNTNTLPQTGDSQNNSSIIAGTVIVGATLAALGATEKKRNN